MRLCGECWPNSSIFIVPALDARSQVLSVSRIEETGLENLCSNLLHLETDNCLPLLHLTCVFLVYRLRSCNGFSLKQTGLMCNGRPFASPLFFAAWRVEAPFSAVSLSDELYNLRSLWLDACPCRTQHLALGKIRCTNAVARVIPCRASFLLRHGSGKVNQY